MKCVFSAAVLATVSIALAATACAQATAPFATAPVDGLVVLKNGEVISGKVLLAGDRYYLNVDGGQIRLRVEEVEFICRSIDEAYQRKAASIDPRCAGDHIELARWCLHQNLSGYAAQELTAALRLDPRDRRIPLVEQKLQSQLAAAREGAPGNATVSLIPDTIETVSDAELESMLRGLAPEAVENYTVSIQPLLANCCQTSGCHRPAQGVKFSLVPLRLERSANRKATLRNLHATLSQVNSAEPQQSRLLEMALEAHGGGKVAPLGDAQSLQYRMLAAWVQQASRSGAGPGQTGGAAASASSDVLSAEPAASSAISPATDLARPLTPGLPNDPNAVTPSFPQGAAAAGGDGRGVDPFDPEIFNRRYGPRHPASPAATRPLNLPPLSPGVPPPRPNMP